MEVFNISDLFFSGNTMQVFPRTIQFQLNKTIILAKI